MRMLRAPNTLHNSTARWKRFKCGANGSSMRILPIGEPMALSLKPCLAKSAFNSATCRSVRSRTLVLRIERNSMWPTPQAFSTSICVCGLGSISSANALSVNISSLNSIGQSPTWPSRR